MPERVRVATPTRRTALTLEQLRGMLAIDEDRLDECLMEQSDLFYNVAEGFALATARRDAAKLDLEQLTASIDSSIRARYAQREERLTETAISRLVAADHNIQNLERELLGYRAECDKWQAMKDAFSQRSYMLREIVRLLIAKMGSLSLERGVSRAESDMAEARRERLGDMRRGR